MINALSEIELEQFEYGYLVTDTYYTAPTFAINIPKLMPLIPKTAATIKQVSSKFNNKIFLNAPECKPQTATSVSTQNHLKIKRLRNAEFEHKRDLQGYMQSGQQFMILVMNKNFRDMYVTDNI